MGLEYQRDNRAFEIEAFWERTRGTVSSKRISITSIMVSENEDMRGTNYTPATSFPGSFPTGNPVHRNS